MNLALAEARKGLGKTSPNPPVGAVIVKDGVLLSKGHHRKAGAAHAEIEALSALANPEDARDSDLFVTLEPCSTKGKTPPCCEAILDAGVRRVVYGCADPNPAHSGKAVAYLANKGLEVHPACLEQECRHLIRFFAKWIVNREPYVIAKAALSMDGKLCPPKDRSPWITGEAARADVQRLRGEVDAILVGAGTVRNDDPRLNIRDPDSARNRHPLRRLIVSRTGVIPPQSKVLNDDDAEHTLIRDVDDWPSLFKDLGRQEITSLVVEGGANVLNQILELQLADEVCLYRAPVLFGEKGGGALNVPFQIASPEYKVFGNDIRVTGKPAYM